MGKKYDKRKTSFLHSDTPLVSERVKVILSSPKDSSKLADAVRRKRKNESESESFSPSKKVSERLTHLATHE